MSYIIGLDVGGTKLRIGAVSEKENRLIAPCEVRSSACLSGDVDPSEVVAEVIRSYLSSAGLEPNEMRAVGVGVPASVSKDFSTICEVPNIPNRRLNALPLGKELTKLLGVPAWVDKDVNLLIRCDIRNAAENKLSGSPRSKTENAQGIVLAVYIGTGIGTAVSIGGNVLYGANGFAMDAGHIPMYHAQGICGCGKKGCAETIAAGRILQEIRSRYFPQTPVDQLFTVHRDEEILKEYVENCAYVPATLATVFDPDLLILGGGVVEMPDFPGKELEADILRLTGRAVAGSGFRILYAEKDAARGVLGAAEFVRERLEERGYVGF